MSGNYTEELDGVSGIVMLVKFETERANVLDYAIVLAIMERSRPVTVRVYDGAHGRNEMHRYTRRSGKRQAEVFHRGTLGEGMRAAIAEVKRGYAEMIDGWQRA